MRRCAEQVRYHGVRIYANVKNSTGRYCIAKKVTHEELKTSEDESAMRCQKGAIDRAKKGQLTEQSHAIFLERR